MTFSGILKYNMLRLCPPKCLQRCYKMKPRERLYLKSFTKLIRELDILYFIKQMRVMKAAIKA